MHLQRNKAFFIIILLALFKAGFAQDADDITGTWLTAEKDGRVEIYKSGDRYFGKLIWGKKVYEADGRTLKKDTKNPNEQLRKRTILNIVLLKDFTYEEGEWTGGKIYDPRTGKTYSSIIKLQDGSLVLRGYVGISAFGKSTVWERVNN
ncbi:uncharacterized protein DUF2147 [Arcticibacter tournemirensis]|uniref:DUF2147 domain-containing protein n=1 Tax=Arcticibacter tournemirensis TaxID=699437 RepID=A0A5M9HCR4_9SPHI|nr:DUF2147 domain-containing protein [Arcticibacter tournemirensis]KAA8484115.1 DUF2147 domain-containing protein [Arcticibacter tournemirensis]TQM51855.1 uncharacterized protein DUF2147 [Arcticibacter tournemirensis]